MPGSSAVRMLGKRRFDHGTNPRGTGDQPAFSVDPVDEFLGPSEVHGNRLCWHVTQATHMDVRSALQFVRKG